jgi:hypothetical protein
MHKYFLTALIGAAWVPVPAFGGEATPQDAAALFGARPDVAGMLALATMR